MPEYKSPISGAVLPPGRPFKQGKEQQQVARRGGKASGEARRARRTCKQLAQLILSAPAPVDDAQKEQLAKMVGIDVEDISINLLSTFVQAQKAAKGDLSALLYLRDTAGEKPADRVEVNEKNYKDLDAVMNELETDEP